MTSSPAKPTMNERILETADRLFYLRGIRAVGVDTIAAEIGISKRTTSRRPNKFSEPSTASSAALPARVFAAARSSTRSPNSALRIKRSRRSRSRSRKAVASGSAIC